MSEAIIDVLFAIPIFLCLGGLNVAMYYSVREMYRGT